VATLCRAHHSEIAENASFQAPRSGAPRHDERTLEMLEGLVELAEASAMITQAVQHKALQLCVL